MISAPLNFLSLLGSKKSDKVNFFNCTSFFPSNYQKNQNPRTDQLFQLLIENLKKTTLKAELKDLHPFIGKNSMRPNLYNRHEIKRTILKILEKPFLPERAFRKYKNSFKTC